jgi:hypothetical protein
MWDPTTTLANQRGPQQRQRPLGRAPLATTNKDADLRRISQSERSELLVPRESSSGAHTAAVSLIAATPSADSDSGRLDPPRPFEKSTASAYRPTAGSQSPGCRRKEDRRT